MPKKNLSAPIVHLPEELDPTQMVAVIPGVSIQLLGERKLRDHNGVFQTERYDKTYKIGDTAEYGSYNLSYFGPIVAIGEKTVTIQAGRSPNSGKKRLDLYTFNWRNHSFDEANARKLNSEFRD